MWKWKRVIQAPMAGAQGHELAAAVHNSGGFGSIPCATLTTEQIHSEVAQFKRLTSSLQVNLNFFAHETVPPDPVREAAWRSRLDVYYKEFSSPLETKQPPLRRSFNAEHMEALDSIRPSVVSFHFGLPQDLSWVSQLQKWGIHVWSSATTVEEAIYLEQVGKVDAIIAQGLEAGGHRGMFLEKDLTRQEELETLLPHIRSHVRIPVIAAGGCTRSPSRWFGLGASAIQVGSCFLLTQEAKISSVYRQSLENEEETCLTNIFTGKPARGLRNRFINEVGPLSTHTCGFPHTGNAVFPLRLAAEAKHKNDFTPLWRGQFFDRDLSRLSAGNIVRELNAEIDL